VRISSLLKWLLEATYGKCPFLAPWLIAEWVSALESASRFLHPSASSGATSQVPTWFHWLRSVSHNSLLQLHNWELRIVPFQVVIRSPRFSLSWSSMVNGTVPSLDCLEAAEGLQDNYPPAR